MTCTHGEVHPSACADCLEGEPEDVPKLSASKTVAARFPGSCAREPEHELEVGQQIHYVPALGWCCGRCARPVQVTEGQARVWQATGWVYRNVQVIEHRTAIQMWCKTCTAVAHLPAGIKSKLVRGAIDTHISVNHAGVPPKPTTKDTTT